MNTDVTADKPDTDAQPGKGARLQSSVQFPYGDLESAVEVATAMFHHGYNECAPDQLAAAMNLQSSGGNFRQRVSAARIFGLVDTSPGRIALTDLAYRVLDQNQKKKALVDAFLSVELYRKLYDDFRSKPLPPRPAALERTFEQYGVSPKQTDKARQAFDRSAKQAGFFNHGNDRLVIPGGLETQVPSEPAGGNKGGSSAAGGAGGGNVPPDLDPLISALLQKMPTGGNWPLSERVKWLRALAMNLSFVYEAGDQETGEIRVSVEPDSPSKQ